MPRKISKALQAEMDANQQAMVDLARARARISELEKRCLEQGDRLADARRQAELAPRVQVKIEVVHGGTVNVYNA